MADFQYKAYKDHDDVDYTFMMKLGDYEFKSYITMWSNKYNEISKEIEQLIYEGSSVISLDFDLSPTKLVVNRQVVSLRVRVEPSDHHKIEPRYYTDYVEEKEFIRTLYDGLLLGTIFCYDEVGCGWNWFDCKMVRYNMMKSRTIEEYLRTSVAEHHKNYVCKHILIYDGKEILHICDETIGYHIPLSDKMDVYDKSGNAIAHINGEMIRNQEFHFIAESLPYDFDFWVIDVDDEGFISSKRIERIAPNNGQVFIKQEEQYEELGQDPYGFTSKTLWHACTDLDAERILHFLSLNADTTYLFKWILNSNKGGTTSSIGEPTYEESEESMRLRDNKKSEILETILNTYPYLSLTERHLDLCAWNYCQACLKVLLEHGANPNEGKFFDDWQFYAVKYRSPLNRVNTMIEDGEEKYGIQHEMKNVLESYGAKDVIRIWKKVSALGENSHMKKLIMYPDYSKSFLWEECDEYCPSCAWIEDEESETIGIEFDDESVFYCKLSGILKWVETFEYESDGVNGNFGTIDSDLFNKEGLRLAHELRKQLPEDVELWYGYAFEDEKNRNSPEILIE